MSGDIRAQLTLWASARAVNEPPNGYPSQAAFAKEMGQGNVSLPNLSDDQHGAIDRAVSQLKLRKPNHHRVILLSYRQGMRDHSIAERLQTTRADVLQMRTAAEYWLDGAINAVEDPEGFVVHHG